MRIFVVLLLTLALIPAALAQPLEGRLRVMRDTATLKIAFRSDSQPFSYLDQARKPTGYSIELCLAIARDIEKTMGYGKLAIEWVEVNSATRFDVIAGGEADLECGSTTVSLSRMARVDFSNLIFVDSTGVLVRGTGTESSFRDLGDRRIGVVAGSTNASAVRDQAERSRVAVTLIDFQDRDLGLAALERGEIFAFATDKFVLRAFNEMRRRGEYKLLSDDLSSEPFAIMMPPGDRALRLAVNSALARIFRSGEVVQLYTKYFGHFGSQQSAWLGALFIFGAIPD